MQVGVDAAGEAIASVYVKPKNSKKHTKTRPFECVPIYRQTLKALDGSDKELPPPPVSETDHEKTMPNVNFLIDGRRLVKATLEEFVDSYGIVFNEVDLVSLF